MIVKTKIIFIFDKTFFPSLLHLFLRWCILFFRLRWLKRVEIFRQFVQLVQTVMSDQTFEKLVSSESLIFLESFTLVLNHLESGFLVQFGFGEFLLIDTNLLEHLFVIVSDTQRILAMLASRIVIYSYRIATFLWRLTLTQIVFAIGIARSL